MKWTTANIKNPQYTENHVLYVGTQTGSFKKLTPASEEKPFGQVNLHELTTLDKESKITALAFANDEHSEILIGRGKNTVDIHSLRSEEVIRQYNVETGPVVGVACYEDALIAGFEDGRVQRLCMLEDQEDNLLISSGDNMSHLRQCATQKNIVATGGKERKNNLKIFDMAVEGKQMFSSKNLPNDYLQLEVPIWDSDIAFIDSHHTIATCSRYGYVRVYDTRKQRRPVQCFASEEPQMSFATIAAQGNYVYVGTTTGGMKAFDIRRMKNFVHTYKGFTGSISDICLDPTGKFLASACLDRYVRVHHTDSCVLLYQCYVKSKASRILLHQSKEKPDIVISNEEGENDDQVSSGKEISRQDTESADEEYERMFDNMQTICDEVENDSTQNAQSNQSKTGTKRKTKTKLNANKKKKD